MSITTNNSTILCGYDHCSTKYGHLGEDTLHTYGYVCRLYKKQLGTMEFPPADRQINAAAARTPPARSTSCFLSTSLTDCAPFNLPRTSEPLFHSPLNLPPLPLRFPLVVLSVAPSGISEFLLRSPRLSPLAPLFLTAPLTSPHLNQVQSVFELPISTPL
jgi:hypothetical protein